MGHSSSRTDLVSRRQSLGCVPASTVAGESGDLCVSRAFAGSSTPVARADGANIGGAVEWPSRPHNAASTQAFRGTGSRSAEAVAVPGTRTNVAGSHPVTPTWEIRS